MADELVPIRVTVDSQDDVAISGRTDGQVLAWSATAGKWVNADAAPEVDLSGYATTAQVTASIAGLDLVYQPIGDYAAAVHDHDDRYYTEAEVDVYTNALTAQLLNKSPLAGSTSIVTVGTVTLGTWQGTPIGIAYGGTGADNVPDARTNLGAAPTASPTFSGTTTATGPIWITNGSVTWKFELDGLGQLNITPTAGLRARLNQYLEVSQGIGATLINTGGPTFSRIAFDLSNNPVKFVPAFNNHVPTTIQAHASQAANLLELKSGSTTLAAFGPKASLNLASLADADAPLGSLYYSTTASRLTFKRPDGTLDRLNP